MFVRQMENNGVVFTCKQEKGVLTLTFTCEQEPYTDEMADEFFTVMSPIVSMMTDMMPPPADPPFPTA